MNPSLKNIASKYWPVLVALFMTVVVVIAAVIVIRDVRSGRVSIGVIDLTKLTLNAQNRYLELTVGKDKDLPDASKKAQELIKTTGQKINQLNTWLPENCHCLVLSSSSVFAMPPVDQNAGVIDLTPMAIKYIDAP